MQTRYERCPNCMQALQGNEDICQSCGFNMIEYEEKTNCLRPFTILQNKYMIGRVIGIGGFGITYIGWDLNLQTYIAIKEYFPDSIASRDTSASKEVTQVVPNEAKKDIYEKGLKRYVEEAQSLSRFYQLQGIVSVKDFFYENGTGYIVMEYINGINLKEYLNNAGGKLDETTVLTLMKPVLESLYQIHSSGMVHRDISPDNIMVDRDNRIKLIDFGSARGQSAETDKTYTVILKHGYAPSEQYYAKGNQGPWTDIYSLCATMYKMLTGQIPPNSVERMEKDEYVAPSAWGVQVSQRTEAVLQKGLAVKVNDRYQNIGELLADLYGMAPMAPATPNVPIGGAVAFSNSASMTQQSMYLNMQPAPSAVPAEAKTRNKKGLIIGGIIGAIAILAIILVFVLGGDDEDKDDKDNTTGTTTEISTDDTTEQSTDEPTEPTTEEDTSAYVWPTELSDSWRDYQISIDGKVYEFPIPYTEWESAGWKGDGLSAYIDGEGSDYASFEKDGVSCYVYIYNFGLNEAPLEDCYIIGISIDIDDVSGNSEIIIPGDIKLGEATLDDIKTTYGAPEYIYEGDTYTTLDYAGDEYEDGMDLEVDVELGALSCISLINTAVPDSVNISPSDISTEVPAINANYVAPEGPSTDRFDHIITLDGVNYVLPVTVSELTANGWILDTATDEYISGNSSTWTYMEKNGNKITVTLENYTSNAMLPINAYITEIGANSTYCSLEVIFPGGIAIGDQGTKFEEVYGDLGDDFYKEEYSDFISYAAWVYGDTYIYINAYADTETGLITEYSYKNSVDEMN